MRTRVGFSLIEVLVALVILEVGVLGVLAMTLQAQRTLRASSVSESVSQAVEWLADSLSSAPWSGPGAVETELGSIRWTGGANGIVTLSVQAAAGARVEMGLSPGQHDGP